MVDGNKGNDERFVTLVAVGDRGVLQHPGLPDPVRLEPLKFLTFGHLALQSLSVASLGRSRIYANVFFFPCI